jgi:ankyrin repeat protein
VWYVGFPLLYLVIGFVGVAGYHSVTNPLRRATAKIMMTRGFLVAVIAGFLGLLGAGIYLSSSGERIWEGKSAALIHAAWNGHTNTVYALLAEGAAVNATTWRGRTALMYAAQRGHPDTLKGLMDRGADVNAKIQDGWTALMLAVANGHADIVKILIERGADVNAKTLRGKTATMLAASEGHTGIVNVLKSAGAKE